MKRMLSEEQWKLLGIAGVGISGAAAAVYLLPRVFAEEPVFPPMQCEVSRFDLPEFFASMQGNLTEFQPTLLGQGMPPNQTVSLVGKAGERGLIACGAFGMTQWKSAYPGYPYPIGEAVLSLNIADVVVDVGFVRVGLASGWKDATGRMYWLEFDLWDSDATMAQMPTGSYIFYKPRGEPPTVEVKSDQIPIDGQLNCYSIPMERYFKMVYDPVYPGLQVELDAWYLVIEKTDFASEFIIEATLESVSFI